MKCRHCGEELLHTFIDLGSSPPSNSYLTELTLRKPEKWYPLKVLVCHNCWLAQTEDFVGFDEMFSEDYAYFSSFSSSWLDHAEKYVAEVTNHFKLDNESMVVEVAANDGYLLQYVRDRGIPCYGIEPTKSTANAARQKDIEIIEEFFTKDLASTLIKAKKHADLIVANNVLAHVPDINDFVKAFSILLKEEGVATFEFPHLLNLVKKKQFDTIYHEHFSYLSLTSVITIFKKNGLQVFDVEELVTHGGSLRVYAQRVGKGHHPITERFLSLLDKERKADIASLHFYSGFQQTAEVIKLSLLEFLIQAKRENKKVIAYGAAAKGNTMLNYAGIRSDLVSYVVDKNPAKQGKCMPGSRIPILSEEALRLDQPEYVLVLPWNLYEEIVDQLAYVRDWGGGSLLKLYPS